MITANTQKGPNIGESSFQVMQPYTPFQLGAPSPTQKSERESLVVQAEQQQQQQRLPQLPYVPQSRPHGPTDLEEQRSDI